MDAALRLAMLDPAASLDAVAAAAGVGRATLFRHFPNRQALLRAAGRRVLGELEQRLEAVAPPTSSAESVRAALREALAALLEGGLPLQAVMAAPGLADDPALRAAARRLDRHLAPLFERATAAGLLRPDIDAAWLDAAFDGLLYAAWTAVREGRIAAQRAPDLLLDALLDGFGRPGRR